MFISEKIEREIGKEREKEKLERIENIHENILESVFMELKLEEALGNQEKRKNNKL